MWPSTKWSITYITKAKYNCKQLNIFEGIGGVITKLTLNYPTLTHIIFYIVYA